MAISPAYCQQLEDMTPDESRVILGQLEEHATRHEFICRFRWEPDSIAVWDNRCAMHRVLEDDLVARAGWRRFQTCYASRDHQKLTVTTLRFERLTVAIGAIVHGAELTKPISSSLTDELLQGLLTHQVLVFPDAHLAPEVQVALAECIGPVWPRHPFFPSVTGVGPVAIIEDGPQSPPENEVWHSDMSPSNPPPFCFRVTGTRHSRCWRRYPLVQHDWCIRPAVRRDTREGSRLCRRPRSRLRL